MRKKGHKREKNNPSVNEGRERERDRQKKKRILAQGFPNASGAKD